MRSLLVFPVVDDATSFARYASGYSGDKIVFCSPKSFGIDTEDVSRCDYGPETGYTCSCDFLSALESCTDVLFLPCNQELYEIDYRFFIGMAVDAGKHVLIPYSFAMSLNLGECICDRLTMVKYASEEETNGRDRWGSGINVPSIAIYGITENTNKFEIMLMLKERLGGALNVLCLGGREYSDLFNVNPLPAFLFESISMTDKIRRFTSYYRRIIESAKPDFVVIDVPGGTIPIDANDSINYGEIAAVISSAVRPHAGILSIHYCDINKKLIDTLTTLFKYKYGVNLFAFHVTNHMIYLSPDRFGPDIIKISLSRVTSLIRKEGELPVFNIYDCKSVDMLVRNIILGVRNETTD